MGHQGLFLNAHTAGEISACGFNIHSDKLVNYPWSFEKIEDMGVYCKLLFGIDLVTAETVIQGIETTLGFIAGPANVNMAWSLRYIVAIKR